MKTKFPFNNEIEYGLRAILILQACYPLAFDIDDLSALDYLVVHSGDFNANLPSLHAPTPNRKNEVFIRRSLINKGVELFAKRNLLTLNYQKNGIYYKLTEKAGPFIDSLEEVYTQQVISRASWATTLIEDMGNIGIREMIKNSKNSSGNDIAFHISN